MPDGSIVLVVVVGAYLYWRFLLFVAACLKEASRRYPVVHQPPREDT